MNGRSSPGDVEHHAQARAAFANPRYGIVDALERRVLHDWLDPVSGRERKPAPQGCGTANHTAQAMTSAPRVRAKRMARCPSPPTPTTPKRIPRPAPGRSSGKKTVSPAQNRRAAEAGSIPGGPPACAAPEYRQLYEQIDGLVGDSLLSFAAHRKLWQQTWVTNPGSLMVIQGGFKDGVLTLEGEMHGEDGKAVLQRETWKAEPKGVRESAVMSKDGGKSWVPAFDVLFMKHH